MSVYLVTGGAGFIGSHIVDALVAQGHRVRVLDNFSTGHRANLAHLASRIELVEGDISDRSVVRSAMREVEVVFHQAALASVPRSVAEPLATHEACVTGTVTVLDEARRAGVRRVVYAGSSSAYGDSPWAAKRESDPTQPLSPYAAAKLAGEEYCRAFFHSYGLETVCLRYFNVFGPRQDPNGPYAAVIPRFIARLTAGEPPVIYGDGKQSRDFTFVRNVVLGNLAAAAAPGVGGRLFNVASGRSFSLLSLAQTLNAILGKSLTPVFEPARIGDVRDSLADISSAREQLGYHPEVDFHEGLRLTVESLAPRGKRHGEEDLCVGARVPQASR